MTSWNIGPFPVNPVNWFTFYYLLRNVLDDMYYGTILDDRPVLYLHADVYSPWNVQLYPTRVNDALKEKSQEQLETCQDGAFSVEVIAQLRPPKSYC